MWWDAWHKGAIALDLIGASTATPHTVAMRQSQRVSALLQSAQRHSPLYRRIVGRRDPRGLALQDLPVMHKRELMQDFDDWVADPRLRLSDLRRFIADPRRIGEPVLGEYIVWESSGSAGEPGVFVQDPAALAVYDALEALRRPVLQPLRRCGDPWYVGERLAFVGATTGHFAAGVTVRRLCRMNPWMAAGARSVSFLQPVRAIVAELNAHAPTLLATYPTAALMLAEEAAAGRLNIPLREVWTGGEALTRTMRQFISASLGCPVAQSYGASEFLSIASECRCGALHLNSDWVVLESVDAEYRPVPAGQSGSTTLITNLANHVQPIIRYDLGDRVRLHEERCGCGSALPVVEVEGRVDDSLVFVDANDRPVRLLPLALTTVLEEEVGLFDFEVRQRDSRSLLLRVAARHCNHDALLAQACSAVSRYLRSQGLCGVTVTGDMGLTRMPGRSGKVQRVVAAGS